MIRAAVLLDRDGTVIVERDYISDPDDVILERDAAAGLRRMGGLGLPLVIVSNQSGVGRGFFPVEAVEAVNTRTRQLLAAEGVDIAGFFFCPHDPGAGCACRKPAPGLGLQAAQALDLDLSRCWMIGDKRGDLEFADAVGAEGILLLTGHGMADRAWAEAHGRRICATLLDAAEIVAVAVGDGGSPTATLAAMPQG